MKSKFSESPVAWVVGAVILMFVLMFVISGPGGITNTFTNWSANWSGKTKWLVVQYTQSGEVMNSWEVTGSMQSESKGNGGVYFTTDHGIVHLTGHFIYVQDPTDEARTLYLKKKK